jgi:hypothetical protein
MSPLCGSRCARYTYLMPMLIYKPFHATSTEFVEFWSREYRDDAEELYSDNIGHELTESRIMELFRWKNGGRLSSLKEASVPNNFVERRQELAQLRPNQQIEDLLAHFSKGGVIFRIFWLHCWQPMRFPIFDQHVYRAMAFIQTRTLEEVPPNDSQKIASYVNQYLPFFRTLDGINDQFQDRCVDKALWAFGKFLKMPTFQLPRV